MGGDQLARSIASPCVTGSSASDTAAAERPDGNRLLELERQGRRQGSGIDGEHLWGSWRLEQIWPRQGQQPQALAAAVLRGLGAALEIQPGSNGSALALVNRVRIGGLEVRFTGAGHLQGRRPLLVFSFASCQLRLGDRTLLERQLPAPQPRRRPFFALIGRGSTSDGQVWLAARGRGGGLALWCRQG